MTQKRTHNRIYNARRERVRVSEWEDIIILNDQGQVLLVNDQNRQHNEVNGFDSLGFL